MHSILGSSRVNVDSPIPCEEAQMDLTLRRCCYLSVAWFWLVPDQSDSAYLIMYHK